MNEVNEKSLPKVDKEQLLLLNDSNGLRDTKLNMQQKRENDLYTASGSDLLPTRMMEVWMFIAIFIFTKKKKFLPSPHSPILFLMHRTCKRLSFMFVKFG